MLPLRRSGKQGSDGRVISRTGACHVVGTTLCWVEVCALQARAGTGQTEQSSTVLRWALGDGVWVGESVLLGQRP